MADIKWSAFPTTAAGAASGDKLVGLHSADNYQFTLSPSAVALAVMQRDANNNASANNFLSGYATTATAAGTTTLLVGSAYLQYFTGSTTQTVVMPVTSTLVLGQSWMIVNKSSGSVTVNSSGGNAIQVLAANTSVIVTCILTSGTSEASWNATYIASTGLTGAVLLAPSGTQTITGFDLVVNTINVGLGAGGLSTNTAIGVSALATNNSGGARNTALGYQAGLSLVNGNQGVFIGYQAGKTGTSMGGVVCIGDSAGALSTADECTFIGYSCAPVAVSSPQSTIVGGAAAPSMLGARNTMLGYNTGSAAASGSAALTTGTNNLFLGHQASGDSSGCSGAIALGYQAVALASTGGTSSDNGPGISIGSTGNPVGFRGDASVYPTAGSSLGYWRVVINGTICKIQIFADA